MEDELRGASQLWSFVCEIRFYDRTLRETFGDWVSCEAVRGVGRLSLVLWISDVGLAVTAVERSDGSR